MLISASEAGVVDLKDSVLEIMSSFRRAGILHYNFGLFLFKLSHHHFFIKFQVQIVLLHTSLR